MTLPTQDDAAERKIRELIERFAPNETGLAMGIRLAWAEATEAAALKCDPWLNREEAKLRAGELSAQEWRAVRAVVTSIQAGIRGGKL